MTTQFKALIQVLDYFKSEETCINFLAVAGGTIHLLALIVVMLKSYGYYCNKKVRTF